MKINKVCGFSLCYSIVCLISSLLIKQTVQLLTLTMGHLTHWFFCSGNALSQNRIIRKTKNKSPAKLIYLISAKSSAQNGHAYFLTLVIFRPGLAVQTLLRALRLFVIVMYINVRGSSRSCSIPRSFVLTPKKLAYLAMCG